MSKRNSRTRSQLNYKSIKKEKEKEQSKSKIVLPSNFQFVCKKYSNFLNCQVCHQLMKHPIRLHNCGHSFCNDCVTSTKCPNCSLKIIVKQRNLIAIGMINQLKVRCLNSGCPFNGTYEEYLTDHGKNCKLKQGMDMWMLKMQALMQDFNTCKMKQTETLQLQEKQGNEDKQNEKIEQKGYNVIKESPNIKFYSNYRDDKEDQQSSNRRRKNLMQFLDEQQLCSKTLMKEL